MSSLLEDYDFVMSVLDDTSLLHDGPLEKEEPLRAEVMKHARPEQYEALHQRQMQHDARQQKLDAILDHWEGKQ